MLKVNNNSTRMTSMFLLLTLNIFRTFCNVSIVDFEPVNVSWVALPLLQNLLEHL